MKINQSNYEAFMLDYLEGNISDEDKALLLEFLDKHPGLKGDMDVPVDLSLTSDVIKPVFDASGFKKHPADEYGLAPLEYLYIKEFEEGLSEEEREEQLLLEPDASKREADKQLYAQSTLHSDNGVEWNHKSRLKRFVLFSRLNQYKTNRVAAVIAVVLLATSLWFAPDYWVKESSAFISETRSQLEDNKVPEFNAEAKLLEKKIVLTPPPSEDSLRQIAKDPMKKREKVEPLTVPSVHGIVPVEYTKMIALTTISIHQSNPVNGYELGLNVMMPQYMSNNVLQKELADIYRDMGEDGPASTKSLALVESGVKVLNFFSKQDVSLDKFYDKQGNIVGYSLVGNGLNVKRRMR